MNDKFVPESVLKELVVGTHIRYIPTGDCNHNPSPESVAASYGATAHEGYTNAEGETGIIINDTDIEFLNHPYKIRMDKNYQFGNHDFGLITLAAYELALVEE